MASVSLSKGDRAAVPMLCAEVDKLRQERSSVAQRVKFIESSKCTKDPNAKLTEVAAMEKRLCELDTEIKDLFIQVKSSVHGALHSTVNTAVMSVLDTDVAIDAIDGPLAVVRKQAKQMAALANRQLNAIEDVHAAKIAASCSNLLTADAVDRLHILTDTTVDGVGDLKAPAVSEVDELAASLGLDATPGEASSVPPVCDAAGSDGAPAGSGGDPAEDADADAAAAPVVARPKGRAKGKAKQPAVSGSEKCRFCSFSRDRQATVTKHEKKEHPEKYAQNIAPPKKRARKTDATDPAQTQLWGCTSVQTTSENSNGTSES